MALLQDIGKRLQDFFNQGSHVVGNIYNTVNSNPFGHQVLNTAANVLQPNPLIRQSIQIPQVQQLAMQNFQHGVGAVGQGIQSAIKGFTPGLQQQTNLGDIRNVARGYGYVANPGATAIGGLFTGAIQAGQNMFQHRPIMNGLPQAIQSGNDFAATLAPLGMIAPSLPGVNKVANIVPGSTRLATTARNVLKGGVEQFATGTGYGLLEGQNPIQALKTGAMFAPYGAFQAIKPEGGVKMGVNPNESPKMAKTDLEGAASALERLANRSDPQYYMSGQRVQDQNFIRQMAGDYFNKKFANQKDFQTVAQEMANRVRIDQGMSEINLPGGMGFVNNSKSHIQNDFVKSLESSPTTNQGQNTPQSVGEILQTKQPFGGQNNQPNLTTNLLNSSDNSIPLPVNPPQRVSAIRQAFDRARNIIASQGPAGQQLAQSLQDARNQSEITAGKWVSQMPTVRNLSKQEFSNFVDVSEGNAKPLSQKVTKAVQEWDNVRNQVYNDAKNSGLDIGKLTNYFPHTYDPKIFQDKNLYNEALNHLVESGQVKTQADAIKLLSYAQDISRNRKQGNLEFERIVNLPNFQKTKDALFGYIESVANRIAQTQNFGAQDEKALKLIEQIARDGGDAQTVKSLFDISSGARKYGALQSSVSRGLRGFNSITKLGTGAITNAGQSINTATVVGGIRTLVNAPKAMFSPEAKDFALKAGTTLDGVLQDLREGGGNEGKLGKFGAPGFNTVEKFNRRLASIAGRDYARSLAAKGDTKTLAGMGIELKGNKLTPEQEIHAARNIVERTQFKVDPQDLPGWASSPWGKVVAQFRQFSYNQSAFMGREVLGPALKGNVAPLIRFLAIGIPLGMGIQTTKNIIRNRKDEQNPVKRVQQGFSQVGGLGLAGDVVTGLFPQNGKYLDPNRATTLAISTLGGPTFGTAAEGYGALTNAIQGKPENLGRFAVRQVPVIGSTLQNTLLPYKAADGSVNQRFQAGQAGAAGTTPLKTTGVDYLSKDQADAEIKKLDAQEKTIKGNNGVFGMGGLSTDQKNAQVAQIESQKEYIRANQEIIDLGQNKGTGIKAFTSVNDSYTLGRQIWDNSKLSQSQKLQAFNKLGLDPQDIRYDSLAHNGTDVSIQYIKSKSPDHTTLLNNLYTGRQVSISGTQFASDAVISQLNKEGLISNSEAKALKALKLDKNGNNLLASTETGRKPKKISIKTTKVTALKTTALKLSKTPKYKIKKTPTFTLKKTKSPKAIAFKSSKFKLKTSKRPTLSA